MFLEKHFLKHLRGNRWVPFFNTMFDNKTGTILVDEDKETIVGASIFGNSRDGIEDHGEVYSFYINPKYSRKNFGRQLIESTFNYLQEKYDVVDVWVLKENKRAIDFYEALGFIKSGKEKNIVEDDTLLPHLLLNSKLEEA